MPTLPCRPLRAAALLLSAAAAAQCPFSSVSTQSYGQPCTTVFATPPTLAARLDVNACALDLSVTAFSGCCNTFLTARVLALGVQQASVPVPQIGPGCTLLVQPAATLLLPSSGGDTFTLSLPPLQPPLSFHAQAAALYFTTIGFSNDAQLTEGQTVTLL